LDIAVVLTVGKYVFLVSLYAFVLAVFRGMMRQLTAERDERRRPERAGERREMPPSRERPPDAPQPSAASRIPPPTSAAPHLLVVESHEGQPPIGAEFPLSAAVTIGRNDENAISLDDRYVSGSHALILLREGRRVLVDRGSTNGTLVNGNRVDAEVELSEGDRISVGRTVFEYHAL